MSFAGHALDAIQRIQYNRSILKLHRARYKELKQAVSKIKSEYHSFHDRNQFSEKELELYKNRIKAKIKQDRQKSFLISGFITLVVIGLIYFAAEFLLDYFLKS
ncbi:MAG: hypothetical protein KQH79_05890 [Bacteroidetes bacterium]|nr:hypothetical protein [Bacteroidota bacterium]